MSPIDLVDIKQNHFKWNHSEKEVAIMFALPIKIVRKILVIDDNLLKEFMDEW